MAIKFKKCDNNQAVFRTIIYEAYIEFKKVGYAVLHPGCKDGSNLANLFVEEEYRQQGIASALLSHVLNEHQERIYLQVVPYGKGERANLQALKDFYKKHGFTEEGSCYFARDQKKQS